MANEAIIDATQAGALAVAALRMQLRSAILTAGHAGYDQARRLPNGRFDQCQALIIRHRDAADVACCECSDWLRQAEHGERVVINLRPDTDAETDFIGVDRPRLLRILERIAADY